MTAAVPGDVPRHVAAVNAVTRCLEGCAADYFPAPLEGCGEVDAGM